MNPGAFDLFLALTMVAVSAALVVAFARYRLHASARRTMSMLDRAGVDPEIASCAERRPLMRDVHRRCHGCATEAHCDRWLAGGVGGDDAFCPNAGVFHALARREQIAS